MREARKRGVGNRAVQVWIAALLLTGLAWIVDAASAQNSGDTYFEFGTVVALGKRDIDLQTFDPQRQRLVQRSYALGRDTRADAVHVGDTVEVIYETGPPGTEWIVTRLLLLRGNVPKAGPAGGGSGLAIAVPGAPGSVGAGTTAPATRVPPPATQVTGLSAPPSTAPVSAVPARKTVAVAKPGKAGAQAAVPRASTQPLASAAGAPKPPPGKAAVTLAGASPKAVPGVVAVPMGVAADSAAPKTPKVKGVNQEAPGQQCSREADWPSQPISMAVLDFRYPTEHEEANDVSKTGGGSGTAVADLVYNRLSDQPELQMRRGDREKLFRMDFAGAARLGRQLGVDTVLLGTFAPVEVVSRDPAFPDPVQAYTLIAGVVETCTGQLLYRLTSVTCAAASSGAPPASCPGSQIPVKDTVNPLENAGAYRGPIDLLLAPLLHNGTPAGVIGGAGTVTAAGSGTVTIRLGPQGVKPGDQVSIHAFRLAKNPTTNTLQRFNDQEIGRMTVARVSGGSATGTYLGDVTPRAGDTAELVTE